MIDCRDCKRWRDCIGKPWYSFSDIRWCPFQVMFIIEHRGELLDGEWPDSPDNSSYTDAGIQTSPGHEAYYVKPELVIGEVEKRLETTREAGEALIGEVDSGLSIDGLSPPAYRALMYLKGKTRKRVSYPLWKTQGNYYKYIAKNGK